MQSIPVEIFIETFRYLNIVCLINISEVCHLFYFVIKNNRWHKVIKNPKRYKNSQIIKILDNYNSNLKYLKVRNGKNISDYGIRDNIFKKSVCCILYFN